MFFVLCSDPFPGSFGFHVGVGSGQGWLVSVEEKGHHSALMCLILTFAVQ